MSLCLGSDGISSERTCTHFVVQFGEIVFSGNPKLSGQGLGNIDLSVCNLNGWLRSNMPTYMRDYVNDATTLLVNKLCNTVST